jgi:hypothetical protein
MEMMLWNVVLSAIVGIMGFLLKSKFDELQRLSILLNRTREEVARDHITRSEFRADMAQEVLHTITTLIGPIEISSYHDIARQDQHIHTILIWDLEIRELKMQV